MKMSLVIPCYNEARNLPGLIKRCGALIDLAEAGLKLCLVSPELQGRAPETEVAALKRHFADHDIAMDAVCTKRADLWS